MKKRKTKTNSYKTKSKGRTRTRTRTKSKSNMRKGRVTLAKSKGGYDVKIGGRGVALGKTKNEAQYKANQIRKQQGKPVRKPVVNKTKTPTKNPITLYRIKPKSTTTTTKNSKKPVVSSRAIKSGDKYNVRNFKNKTYSFMDKNRAKEVAKAGRNVKRKRFNRKMKSKGISEVDKLKKDLREYRKRSKKRNIAPSMKELYKMRANDIEKKIKNVNKYGTTKPTLKQRFNQFFNKKKNKKKVKPTFLYNIGNQQRKQFTNRKYKIERI
ncbi:MAG: hypothetical protein ACOC56_02870 [Atribacterota bacterium]